jgi:hypothetical protein
VFIQGTDTTDSGIGDCDDYNHEHDLGEKYDDEGDDDDDESDISVPFSPSL